MNNFTDGNSDGLVLFYAKGGKVYPVKFIKEEMELLDAMIGGIITKASPILDMCMGDLITKTPKEKEGKK